MILFILSFCRNTIFANVYNLNQCIIYLNQALVTLGFAAKLDLLSTKPMSDLNDLMM